MATAAHAHAHAPPTAAPPHAPTHNPGDYLPPRPQAEIAAALPPPSAPADLASPPTCDTYRTHGEHRRIEGPSSCWFCQQWDDYHHSVNSGNVGGRHFDSQDETSWQCRERGRCHMYWCCSEASG